METNSAVVFILGSTGSGKSKLSLDLAKTLDGEIINADSMQIYCGNLDGAMTANPSPADLKAVPHHLYSFVPMEEVADFNVQKYQALALEKIQEVQSRGKVPIVAGGTNYYIEALLFEIKNQQNQQYDLVNTVYLPECPAHIKEAYDQYFLQEKSKLPHFKSIIEDFEVAIPPDEKQRVEDKYAGDVQQLHALLSEVDPKMGQFFHTNDKRKIVNALFKYFKISAFNFINGKTDPSRESQIQYTESSQALRFLPILIEIKADIEVIEQRVAKRSKKMVYEEGGLEEAFHVFDKLAKPGSSNEAYFEKGILQAIGYKEYYPLYLYLSENHPELLTYSSFKSKILEPEAATTGLEGVQNKLVECISKLNAATIKYAKYQKKWLNRRIATAFAEADSPSDQWFPLMERICLNNAKDYEEIAYKAAFAHYNKTLSQLQELGAETEAFKASYCDHLVRAKQDKLANWQKRVCEFCALEINGEKQWKEHIATKRHKALEKKARGEVQLPSKRKKMEKTADAMPKEEQADVGDLFGQEEDQEY